MAQLLNKYLPDSISSKSLELPSRLDAKKDTKANLETYALTATNGEFVYATDTKEYFGIKDGALDSLGGAGGSDIEGSDTIANNQTTFLEVTGFDVSGNSGFKSLVNVFIDATTDQRETFNIQGNFTGSAWEISVDSLGSSGVEFTINTLGQLFYKSEDYSGYSDGTIEFEVDLI